MLGMSPSLPFVGSESDLSGCGLSTHAVTVWIVSCFLHLPIWMTSGTCEPAGAFLIVNFPDVSVSAVATGLPV